MFSDKRFLSNSIRSWLIEKKINIYVEQQHKRLVNSVSSINKEAAIATDSTSNSSSSSSCLLPQTISSESVNKSTDTVEKNSSTIVVDKDIVTESIVSHEYISF
jgi:hypothetical protein